MLLHDDDIRPVERRRTGEDGEQNTGGIAGAVRIVAQAACIDIVDEAGIGAGGVGGGGGLEVDGLQDSRAIGLVAEELADVSKFEGQRSLLPEPVEEKSSIVSAPSFSPVKTKLSLPRPPVNSSSPMPPRARRCRFLRSGRRFLQGRPESPCRLRLRETSPATPPLMTLAKSLPLPVNAPVPVKMRFSTRPVVMADSE